MLNKILCVDDASDIRSVLEVSLKMIGGFELCLCASGEEAIEKIDAFNPDLVLLDVLMPSLSGPDTLTQLRRLPQFKETPVIFMTGQQTTDEVNHLKQLGSIGVISKPFQPTELAKQIEALWQEQIPQ